MGYRSIISLMPKTPPVDADAQAFLTAAAITDPTISGAINTLVVQMKADNIWSKMKAVYPMVGGTANSHKFNLKDPRDLDAAFRIVFNGGWTHNSNGATPNGTNAFADTKLNTRTQTTFNSLHLSYYSRTNTITGGKTEIGNIQPGFLPIVALSIKRTESAVNDRFVPLIYSFNAPDIINAANTDSRGYFLATRTASNSFKAFKNSIQQGSTVTTNGQVNSPDYPLFIGATNNSGTASGYSDRETAFASIGDGLTDTEAANLYTRVQAFQTALSRQV